MLKYIKTISAYTENIDLIFKALKKLFISWHCPFKSAENINNTVINIAFSSGLSTVELSAAVVSSLHCLGTAYETVEKNPSVSMYFRSRMSLFHYTRMYILRQGFIFMFMTLTVHLSTVNMVVARISGPGLWLGLQDPGAHPCQLLLRLHPHPDPRRLPGYQVGQLASSLSASFTATSSPRSQAATWLPSRSTCFILASFFYGYILTQIPGGYLATK